MRRTRSLTLLLAALATTLALAACGGDDDGGGDEDADITDAIERAATENEPANCTEVQTVAFNEQTQFEEGDAAVEACEEDTENVAGEEVEVSNIEVDGDAATAEVAFSGGNLDAQTLSVGLVKEDDQWKLDSLDEFIEFDQAAFTAGIVEEASADSETPPEVVTCVEDQLTSAEEATLQEAYLSGDEEQLFALFGTCFQ